MEYRGEKTCAAANLVPYVQGCTYGCLGLGDCAQVCEFDALAMNAQALPVVEAYRASKASN